MAKNYPDQEARRKAQIECDWAMAQRLLREANDIGSGDLYDTKVNQAIDYLQRNADASGHAPRMAVYLAKIFGQRGFDYLNPETGRKRLVDAHDSFKLAVMYARTAAGMNDDEHDMSPALGEAYLAFFHEHGVMRDDQLLCYSAFQHVQTLRPSERKHQNLIDYARVFTHHLRAARAGLPYAQMKVGELCLLGRGVAYSLEVATYWLNKAALNRESLTGQDKENLASLLELSQKSLDQVPETTSNVCGLELVTLQPPKAKIYSLSAYRQTRGRGL